MKAVNLIPGDARRAGGMGLSFGFGPGTAVIGVLGAAVLFVSFYVLTSNTISDRQAKLTTLQAQVTEAQAQASRLANYAAFVTLAQARVDTVRQIASSRFDWHGALSDLSKVIPANASLQSLTGTVAPGASVIGAGGSAGGAGSSSLRGDIAAPAFEMQGCTQTQDDVARLMSRLRLINGVQRVTLASSVKQDGGQSGAAVSAPSSGAGAGASAGCGSNAPTYDLVIFFTPLRGGSASTPIPGAAPSAAAAAQATPSTPVGAAPAPSTTPAAAQPVSTTSPSGGSK